MDVPNGISAQTCFAASLPAGTFGVGVGWSWSMTPTFRLAAGAPVERALIYSTPRLIAGATATQMAKLPAARGFDRAASSLRG